MEHEVIIQAISAQDGQDVLKLIASAIDGIVTPIVTNRGQSLALCRIKPRSSGSDDAERFARWAREDRDKAIYYGGMATAHVQSCLDLQAPGGDYHEGQASFYARLATHYAAMSEVNRLLSEG